MCDMTTLTTPTETADDVKEKPTVPTVFRAEFTLNDQKKRNFFWYLCEGKMEPYKAELVTLMLTERELVERALTERNIPIDAFVKEALIEYSKTALINETKRKVQDQTKELSPYTRLENAYKELTSEIERGIFKPRSKSGGLSIAMVAARSRVNYRTARLWADVYHPELLDD